MLDAYDLARLEGFAGTREEFLRMEYLNGGVDVAIASGFEGDPTELVAKIHEPSTAAAMALLDMLKGEQGPQGIQGERGERGFDLYQLAKQSGFEGTIDEYLASLKGETGPQGRPGVKGDSGLKGIKGDPGKDGKDGTDGQAPAHEIDGNRVRFERPDGTWGDWIDLGTVTAQASSMGAGTLTIQRFFADVASFPTAGKEQVLNFDMSASPWGTYVWLNNEYKATGGGADILRDFGFYLTNWSSQPTIVGSTSAGNVYLYTLASVNRYRLVPNVYDPTQDAFYDSFTAGVLGTVVAARG